MLSKATSRRILVASLGGVGPCTCYAAEQRQEAVASVRARQQASSIEEAR